MKVIRKFKEVGEFILTTTEGDICIRTNLDFAMKLQVGDVISFASYELPSSDEIYILPQWVDAITNFKGESIYSDELVELLSRENFKIEERNLSDDGFVLYMEMNSYAEEAFAEYLKNFYANNPDKDI
jgi:hypothetical protein